MPTTRRAVLGLLAAAPLVGAAATPAAADGPDRAVRVEDLGDAYLVLPPGPARRGAPAVLALHWFDPPAADSDRTEFLAEAVTLAARGVVSLLPQQRFPWAADPVGDARDVATVRREVARLRRALDGLRHRPEVDPRRVAVVGHDYGAMYGALVAAADPRVSGLVAMTPDATWAHWFLAYWLQREDPAYAALFADLEPADAVAAVARHRPVLLQFADDDPYVDAATRARFTAPATVYPGAGHQLAGAALADRARFLSHVLGLA